MDNTNIDSKMLFAADVFWGDITEAINSETLESSIKNDSEDNEK